MQKIKKKATCGLLSIALIIGVFPMQAFAGELETAGQADTSVSYLSMKKVLGSVEWTQNINGGAIYFDPSTGLITACDGMTTSAEIPKEIDGISVTGIGQGAFQGCKALQAVLISEGITEIGASAFEGCQNLKYIEIPTGVTHIKEKTFSNCTSLTRISIPNSVTKIEEDAFENHADSLMIYCDQNSYAYEFVQKHDDLQCQANEAIVGDEFTYNGHTYKIVNEGMQWTDAEAKCAEMGGHLVTIDSENEQNAINQAVKQLAKAQNCYWIGLTRGMENEEWRWITGEPFGYTNWTEGEPNNYLGHEEKYAMMFGVRFTGGEIKDVGQWNDSANESCEYGGDIYKISKLGYICEWDGLNKEETSYRVTYHLNGGANSPSNPLLVTSDKWYNLHNATRAGYGFSGWYTTPDFEEDTRIYRIEKDTSADLDIYAKWTQHKYSKYEQECVDKIKPDALFKDLALHDIMKGPSVDLAGKEFSLFEFEVGADIEVEDFEIKVELNEDQTLTAHVLYGISTKEGDIDMDGKDPDSYWKETYADVKDLYIRATGKRTDADFYNKFRKVRKAIRACEGRVVIDGHLEVCGFADITIDSNGVKGGEGGILVMADTNTCISVPVVIPAFPWIPAYWTAGTSAELPANFAILPDFKASLHPELTLTGGAGIGSKGDVGIEGLLKGGLEAGLEIDPPFVDPKLEEILQVYAKEINMILKYYVFDIEKILIDYPLTDRFQIYPDFGAARSRSLMMSPKFTKEELLEDTVWKPRDYNLGNITPRSLGIELVKSNIYPNNLPKIESLGENKYLLVWVNDNGTKDLYNRTSIMYSIFDGTGWSTAMPLSDNQYMSSMPIVYNDNGEIVVVWAQGSRIFTENSDVNEVTENTNLYFSKFNGESFSQAEQISEDNGIYEAKVNVFKHNGNICVSWIEHEMDPNDTKTVKSTILCSERTEEGFWKTAAVYETDEEMNEYVVIPDQDKSVLFTKEGVAYLGSSNGKDAITTDGSTVVSVKYENDAIYATVDNMICKYNQSAEAFESLGLASSQDYFVINDDEVIVYENTDEGGSLLKLHKRNSTEGTWNEGAYVVESDNYIRSYDVTCPKQGDIVVAYNDVLVDTSATDPYGKASLIVSEFSDTCEAELLDTIYYDHRELVPGGQIKLNFEIKNNGSVELNGENTKIQVLNSQGTVVVEEPLDVTVGSGELAEVNAVAQLPNSFTKVTYTVKVVTSADEDSNNNSATVTLGYADMNFVNVALEKSKGGNGVLNVDFQNTGFEAAKNVSVIIRDEAADGAVISTLSAGSVSAGSTGRVTTTIQSDKLIPAEDALGKTLYFEVTSSTMEERYDNNTTRLYLENELDLELNQTTIHTEEIGEPYSLTVKDSISEIEFTDRMIWESSDENVAQVDAEGHVAIKGLGSAIISASYKDRTVLCDVFVKESLSFEKTEVSLLKGRTYKIGFNTNNSAVEGLIWTSSDEEVATVSKTGVVTAKKAGTAIVTAKTVAGTEAGCMVIVREPHVVTSLSDFESEHNYANEWCDKWIFSTDKGCSIALIFDEKTSLEDGADYLHIYSEKGKLVGSYTGKQLSGKTVIVPGRTAEVILETNEDATAWGFKVTEAKVLDHKFTKYTDDKAATCTAAGVRTYTCAVTGCSATKTASIAKLGHKYSSSYTVDKKATTSTAGSKSKHCTRSGCSAKKSAIAIPKIASMKLSTVNYTYNGSAKKPSVTVKNSKGTILKSGTDYTVSYASGRTKIGKYKVTVKFKGAYSGSKALYFEVGPKNPSSVKTSLYGYDDVKVSWTKVSGATGYKVYYKKASASSYTLLKTTTATSYKKANLSDGAKYTFKVVAYKKVNGNVCENAGKTSSITTLKKVAGVKVAKSGTKVKVSWANIGGETGYEISQSTSKNGTKVVATYKTTSGTYKTLNATKGKTYYYKVRAYKTVGKTKIYGPWSDRIKYTRK